MSSVGRQEFTAECAEALGARPIFHGGLLDPHYLA
jgi:hypothetical protein